MNESSDKYGGLTVENIEFARKVLKQINEGLRDFEIDRLCDAAISAVNRASSGDKWHQAKAALQRWCDGNKEPLVQIVDDHMEAIMEALDQLSHEHAAPSGDGDAKSPTPRTESKAQEVRKMLAESPTSQERLRIGSQMYYELARQLET